jgi:secreted PhoX family phosphatase
MECELTGPTFMPNGKELILSVQHPGEHHGTHTGVIETRKQVIAMPDGELVEQERAVPLGSNFPHGVIGKAPRPAVVVISVTR